MESPCQAMIQYWPPHNNSRDNTNPWCWSQEHWPSKAVHSICGTEDQRGKRERKKTPCSSSGSCTGIRMEFQSDQCSENNNREAARKSDLVRGSISVCWRDEQSAGPGVTANTPQRCCSSPSCQGWPGAQFYHSSEALRARRHPHTSRPHWVCTLHDARSSWTSILCQKGRLKF